MMIAGLFARPSHALFELGSDFFFSGMLGIANEMTFKSHNYLLFGGKSFALGPVAYWDRPHTYVQDVILGGGVRFGETFFVEIDAGKFRRKFVNTYGHGIAVSALFGFQVTRVFRIVVPVTAKRIYSGLDRRTTFDFLPYLGLRIPI